jgi:ElaB/YqjD/DUF883 family membrane-anchored ribosome-binding protein
MTESVAVIRDQMEETKIHLSEKLETLEQHVSESVQSAGNAVEGTVEAVHDAVRNVTNAFDFQRQIDRHPWLIIGGSVVLGYIAAELVSRPRSRTDCPPETRKGNGRQAAETSTPPISKSIWDNSSWHKLRDVAVGALMGVVRQMVSHSVSPTVDSSISH